MAVLMDNKMVQRSFIIGSEWLYYKIYTGPKTSDAILTDVLLPLANQFKSEGWITKWFFIRYADPKHHLRIRFHVSEKDAVGRIIEHCFSAFKPWTDQDLVWKIQLDTYNRELERYGKNTIELSESLFCFDSEAVVNFLDLIEGEEGEHLRWLFGLRIIDKLLSAFHYDIDDKMRTMEELKTAFGREFNMARPLKKQLDDKYRQERKAIEDFMKFTIEEHPDYQPILEVLTTFYENAHPVIQQILEIEQRGEFEIAKTSLIGSYIHMSMNRLFKSKNRLNEMVCYDFLFRYYKTTKARSFSTAVKT